MRVHEKWIVGLALLLAMAPVGLALASGDDDDDDGGGGIPSVIVKITNLAPSRGTLLTPVWIGIHDGSFDSYDGGQAASVPLGGDEIERLAEDGNTGPISTAFDSFTVGGQQATVVSPGGPFAPGDTRTITLNVDPIGDRYLSYASMIIPSNDAFIANENPLAHQLFDEDGDFVGEAFIVSGHESNDAGTEENDEIAGNVAFLNQAAPNTGEEENGVVASPHPGFAPTGSLAFPDGVLNHPVFGNGQFNTSSYRLLGVELVFVDLGADLRFESDLTPDQEVQADPVDSDGNGRAVLRSKDADEIRVRVRFRNLTGPVAAAHLHLGQAGTNGPVVVDLGDGILSNRVRLTVNADDLQGPLAGEGFVSLLNELAAGNIYINLHTDEFPAGEIRGQVRLESQDNDSGDDDDD